MVALTMASRRAGVVMSDCRPYTTTVKPGDGWYRIASRFQLTAAALTAANGATIRNVLHPGMELIVPGRCAEVPPVPIGQADQKPPFVWVVSTDDDTEERWYIRGRRPRFIIMHDPVAGSVPGLLRYLIRNVRKVSYDDVVVPGSPPKVHVLVPSEEWWVGHAGSGTAIDARTGTVFGLAAGGNLNHAAWAICAFKHTDDWGPFSEPMYSATVALTAERAKQFDVHPQNILSHAEVDPRRRSDPRGISMPRFRAHVIEAMNL